MNTTKVNISTKIAAPAHKVWECWNQPKHIVNWNFATDTWHCPHAENNLTIGGNLKATMAAKDGSFSFDFEAVYDEILPQKYLAYTLLDGRKVTVSFNEEKGHTTIQETFDVEESNPVDIQRAGWQAILDNFKKYVEQV